MKNRCARGFTLVEVMVAVVIAAMLALLAHRLFATALEGADRLHQTRSSQDRAQGARRLLAAMFFSLEVGTREGAGFEGEGDRMRFMTWRATADGWFERETVSLALRETRLTAMYGSGAEVVLADSVTGVQFDYLLQPGVTSRWIRQWISPVSAPIAVRMRLHRRVGVAAATDTTLFLIKARG
jgi:prepilin-type N-terminal cleavage/methylation domain-containing protein